LETTTKGLKSKYYIFENVNFGHFHLENKMAAIIGNYWHLYNRTPPPKEKNKQKKQPPKLSERLNT